MTKVEIIAANLNSKKENSVIKKLKKVCAYARVSTDSDEQLTSYSSQIKYYSSKIKSNPEWEFVGVYADEGISGTQVNNRAEFKKMIDDALNGKIDIILAKSISRFARNTLDTLKYVRLLREHRVDVHFEKENIHTLDMDSEMFLTFYSAFAQAESESISQNVKMGIKAKMKRGEVVGCCSFYGYYWDNKTKNYEINEEQAPLVREIFNMYCDGKGCRTIANILNKRGILSYRKKKWYETTVLHMINNEKYVGDLMGQKSYTVDPISHKQLVNYGEKELYFVKDHHDAIITRDVWNKAQEIFKKRSQAMIPDGKKHKSKYSLSYPFSSKITCGFCGNSYVRKTGGKIKGGTDRHIYWTCHTRNRCSKDCNKAFTIKETLLEQVFIELFNNLIKNKYETKNKLFNAIKSVLEENNYQNDIQKLEDEKAKSQDRLSKLVDMRLDGSIDKDTYLLKEKEIKSNLEAIKEKQKELENLNNENKNISRKLEEIEKIINVPATLTEFDKNVFESLVEKIIVGEVSEDGKENPYAIRFVLKTGVEYKTIIEKMKKNNNRNQSVSFDTIGLVTLL